MRKFISLIIIIFVMITFTQASLARDFRKIEWGMTISEVRNAESVNLKLKVREDKNIILKGTASYEDTECLLYYNFEFVNKDTILTGAGYMFRKEGYVHQLDYIDVFKKLLQRLNKKYGEPVTEEKPEKSDAVYSHTVDWESSRSKIGLWLMLLGKESTTLSLSYKKVTKENSDLEGL